MQDLLLSMRMLYTRPPDVSYSNEPTEAPLDPQVGDLHPWDALVDGCLYIDPMCDDTRPFLMQFNDAWIWLPYEPVDAASAEWQYLLSKNTIRRPTIAQKGDRALVVATSIDTPEKCRDAIAAHRASQTGGAK